MDSSITIMYLAGIVSLGVACQWVSLRFKIPSILSFIVVGLLIGPILRWIPDTPLFGEQTHLMITLALGFILFEGGLSLNLSDIQYRPAIHRLLSVGLLSTLIFTALLARIILDVSWQLSFLMGSILVVTGPTVIGPLLKTIRLRGQAGNLLLWEGMFNDSLGAIATVIVYESIIYKQFDAVGVFILGGLVIALVSSIFIGGVGALTFHALSKYFKLPTELLIPALFSTLILVYVSAGIIQPEGGLLAVTIMGVVLGNMPGRSNQKIIEFAQPVQNTLIASLFLILISQLRMEQLTQISWPLIAFIAALILFVRPVSVALSFMGLPKIPLKKIILIGFTAPRGVVAAAVSTIMGYQLVQQGYPEGEILAPTIVWVIIATCFFYSIFTPLLARGLKLSKKSPNGIFIVGVNPLTVALGKILSQSGIDVQLADISNDKVRQGILNGLPTIHNDIMSTVDISQLDVSRFKYLLAATASHKVNTLANHHYSHRFSAKYCYQLPPDSPHIAPSTQGALHTTHGQFAFYPTHALPPVLQKISENSSQWHPVVEKIKIERDQNGDHWAYQHSNLLILAHLSAKEKECYLADSNFSSTKLEAGDELVVLHIPPSHSQNQQAIEDITTAPSASTIVS